MRFRYNSLFRVFFLAGGVLFTGVAIFALWAEPRNGGGLAWPAIAFLGFAGVLLWLARIYWSTFETDAEGITQRRFGLGSGKALRLLWRDIERAEHRPVSASMLLRTGTARMRIHRQVRGFVELSEIVRKSVPADALEPPLRVPFSVPAGWNLRIVFGGLTLFLLGMGVYALAKEEWVTAAILTAFAGSNVWMLANRVCLRFEFNSCSFRTVYFARADAVPASSLESAALVQRDLDIAVILQFATCTVELSDNQILTAPERVYEAVVRDYGLDESQAG